MVHRKKRGYSIAVRWWSSAAVIDLSASPRVFFSIFHPGGKNMKDEFEELIDTAFVLNGDYSIYEVMDLDRPGRHRTDGGDVYGPPDLKRIERYVAILDRIGEWREPAPSWLTETWKGSVLQRSPFWQYYGILQCGTWETVDAILAKNAAHAGSAGQKKKTEHRAARRHSTATIHCKDSLSEGENRQGCYSFFFIKRYLYCLRDTIPRIGLSWMKLRTFKAANSTALLITPGTIAELCGEPMKLESSQKDDPS